jgi:hypothetical protein
MIEPKEAYPLCWPVGYKRTLPNRRRSSQFKQSMEAAQRFLRIEVSRLGGRELIVSTNIPVRQDGGLYSDWMKRKIDDPGVAIYFKYKGKDVSMCGDQYERIWENLYALGKGIEALRGMERWGISEFLDRAFTGFAALPSATIVPYRDIWKILGLEEKPSNIDDVHLAYKAKAKQCHPDTGGSVEAFQELQEVYRQAVSNYT